MVGEQNKFLLDFCLLILYATRIGFVVTAGELMRPIEMQKIYFDTGRSKTMRSKHLDKMAGDLNIFRNGIYINGLSGEKAEKIIRPLGKFWESLDKKNRWGGNFDMDWSKVDPWKDIGHFERIS